MSNVNTFVERTYYNNTNFQKIDPGDNVVFIATSYKTTMINAGIFRGIIVDPEGKVVAVSIKAKSFNTSLVGEYKTEKDAEELSHVLGPNYFASGKSLFNTKYHTRIVTLVNCRVFLPETPISQLIGTRF